MHDQYWSEWMGLSILFWLILIVILILVLAKAFIKIQRTDLTAKQILEQRYARGEINKEEFERKLKDLKLD